MKLDRSFRPRLQVFLHGALLLTVGLLPFAAQASNPPRSEALGRKIELSFDNSGTSDQLIALAKAGHVNVVADATQFGEHPRTVTVTETDHLLNWALKISSEQDLSWREDGTNIFLFWSEPDPVALANDLIHDPQLNALLPAPVAPRTPGPKRYSSLEASYAYFEARIRPDAEVSARLAAYLMQVGWDGKSADFSARVPLSQLPPELSSQIKARVASQVDLNLFPKYWFEPDIWDTVRVGVGQLDADTPALVVTAMRNGQKPTVSVPLAIRPRTAQAPRLRALRATCADETGNNAITADAAAPVLPAVLPDGAASVQAGASISDLTSIDRLKTPVSLEAKEQPLADVLASLQGQSGIILGLAPDAALNQNLVTLSVAQMPLGELMNALAHLYGAKWSALGEGYALRDGVSATRQKLLQVGDLDWYRYWKVPGRYFVAPKRLTLDEPTNWNDEFARVGQQDALESPDGVAFSALPPELQTKIRWAVQRAVGEALIRNYMRVALLDQDLVLQTRPSAVGKAITTRKTPQGNKTVETEIPSALEVLVRGDMGIMAGGFTLDAESLGIGQRLIAVKQKEALQQTEPAPAATGKRR